MHGFDYPEHQNISATKRTKQNIHNITDEKRHLMLLFGCQKMELFHLIRNAICVYIKAKINKR